MQMMAGTTVKACRTSTGEMADLIMPSVTGSSVMKSLQVCTTMNRRQPNRAVPKVVQVKFSETVLKLYIPQAFSIGDCDVAANHTDQPDNLALLHEVSHVPHGTNE